MFTVTFSDWFVSHTYEFPDLLSVWQFARANGPCFLRTPMFSTDVL